MTIDIDWAGTATNPYRIFVPRADMPIVQASPEIRELDVNTFRLVLKDLEASAEGIPWPDTHRHVTETTLSGAVYARLVEILSPYLVEFEDGQYSVRATGANHNILDVKVNNQVSLAVQNSAGLTSLAEIQYSSFNGVVSVDVTSPYSGTLYPTGTPRRKVNNLADALAIASERGISRIHLHTNTTLSGLNFSGKTFEGHTVHVVVTVDSSATVTGCIFERMTITGTLDGSATIRGCHIIDLDYVDGEIDDCTIDGTLVLSGQDPVHIIACRDGMTGTTIDCGGTGSELGVHNWRGDLTLINKSGPEAIVVDLVGQVELDATMTGGTLTVRGVGPPVIIDGATITVDQDGLVSPTAVDILLSATHGAGAWDSAGSGDWSATERDQIRGALGITGTQATPAGGGHLQDIRTPVVANLNATVSSRATQAQILSDATPFQGARIDAAISSRAAPGDVMDLTVGQETAIFNEIATRAAPGDEMELTAPQESTLLAAIASRAAPGEGLTTPQATMLLEIYKLLGLDPTKPLVVTQTSRKVPEDGSDIDQTIDESAGTVTVTRQ